MVGFSVYQGFEGVTKYFAIPWMMEFDHNSNIQWYLEFKLIEQINYQKDFTFSLLIFFPGAKRNTTIRSEVINE